MINLLRVEFYKLKKFSFGYIALLFMIVIGYLYGDSRLGNNPFPFTANTEVLFVNTVGDTSFVFLIAITAALFMGKDFSSRTICNEIKLGHSRVQILLSRMFVVGMFSVLLHLAYLVSATVGFCVVRGFDASMFCMENVVWLLTVLTQLAALTSLVVLITFLTKKVSEAIALSALSIVLCCNILRNFIHIKIYTLSCFCFVQNSKAENLGISFIGAVVTMVLFLSIAAVSFQKAEVK